MTKRRWWWLAGLWGLWGPGLGQVYNGQARKGLTGYALLVLSLLALGALLNWGPSPWIPFVLLLLPISLYLYLLVDAIVTAFRTRDSFQPRFYNRWFVYLVLLFVWGLPGRWTIQTWSTYVAHSFYLPAGSMEPTLLVGDYVYVDKWRYRSRDPQRGDLITFVPPENPNILVVKRVVGLPGDRIEIRKKRLFLNDQELKEPYVVHRDPVVYDNFGTPQARRRDNWGPALIPKGYYFLLGDNRDNSYDSRFFGPVPRDSIQGGGRMTICWSRDPSTGEILWDRIGRIRPPRLDLS
jgi:signal peptidase I